MMIRTLRLSGLLLALALVVPACQSGTSDGGGSNSSDVTEADSVAPDASDVNGSETTPETAGEVVDETTDPETVAEPVPEVVDETPVEGQPMMNVFAVDPVTNDREISAVLGQHLTDPDGYLTGSYATVYNCLNDDEHAKEIYSPGGSYTLCWVTQTALPGEDGTYLHIEPPAVDTDPNDTFAETMMYYHINQIHDYFSGTHGVTHMDEVPITGLVNLGMKYGGQWQAFDNAAFMPKESMGAMGIDFDEVEGDATVFGQGTFVDFTYDASVIYHEFTHAVIGEGRLLGDAADVYGLNPEPMALNEAHADYFAASYIGTPQIGKYALDMPMMGDLSRNLDEFRHCPEDMIGESHYDGRMWSAAMWAVREVLGAEITDRVVFNALMQYGNSTTFHEAADIILTEAALEGAEVKATFSQIMNERNVAACERVKPYVDIDWVPHDQPLTVKGSYTTQIPEFVNAGAVPMAFQYVVDVPEGTAAIEFEFKARVSDQMAQYGDFQIKPQLAFRVDQPVAYSYGGSQMSMSADLLLDPEPNGGNSYKVSLAGTCVQPGSQLYLHFLNVDVAQGYYGDFSIDMQISSMSMDFIEDASDLPLTFDGCE